MAGPRRCEAIEIPFREVSTDDATKLMALIEKGEPGILGARVEGTRLIVALDHARTNIEFSVNRDIIASQAPR